ncbi:Concanavalin A-like lectin/glucanases superfamily protein [uncultured archaeon]|nr:Concanavalin A-like lectin/glucanases superfamily protein [uncultured archaeon]
MKSAILGLSDQRAFICLGLCSLSLCVFMLSPLLNSGFFGDDAATSFVNGDLAYSNLTLSQFIYNNINMWTYNGRFFPLAAVIGSLLLSFVPNLFLYKLLAIAFNVINILIFAYLIRSMTGLRSLSLLAILSTPVFLQFRMFHDSIMSFTFLLQTVFFLTVISAIFLISYLKSGKRIYLFSSLILYFLSMLTYEATLPFFILYILIIYFYSENRNSRYVLKLSFLFIALSLLCISIPIIIRIHYGLPLVGGSDFTTGSSAYVPNINAKEFAVTLAKQTFSALPLSYQIVNYFIRPTETINDLKNILSPTILIIILAYFLLYWSISKRVLEEVYQQQNQFDVKILSIFGLFLLVLPATLVSLSPRYQKEIYWGVGYLPVYISYFGAVIIALCAIYVIYDKTRNCNRNYIVLISLIIAATLSITGALTYNSNVLVIEHLDSGWLYPRLIIEEGLADGLFRSVPNGSILLVDSGNPWWEQPSFYLMHSGIRLSYVGSASSNDYVSDKLPRTALIGSYQNKSSYQFSASDNIIYLRYYSQARNDGYAILGTIKDLQASKKTLDHVTGTSAFIYVHYADNTHRNVSLYGWTEESQPQSYKSFCFDEEDLKLISSDKNWKLFFINMPNKTINLQSLQVLSASKLEEFSSSQIFSYNNTSNRNDNAQESRFAFSFSKNPVLHCRYDNGSSSYISWDGRLLNSAGEKVLGSIYLNENFSIEILVYPMKEQVKYAAILGNHPGNGNEGFVIQQNSLNQNEYTFGFGNGREWLPNIKFNLTENKLNHLLIKVRKNQTNIYINGEFMASANTIDSIKNSYMPLYIGDWIGGDRPFHGIIKEVKIVNDDEND